MTAGGRAREGDASGGMDARPRGRRRHDVRTWEGDTDGGTSERGTPRSNVGHVYFVFVYINSNFILYGT